MSGYQDEDMETEDTAPIDLKVENVYFADKIIGRGTFSTVYRWRVGEDDEFIAIKKLYYDRTLGTREADLLKELKHPNIIEFLEVFYTKADDQGGVNLNIVMEHLPSWLYRQIRNSVKNGESMPMLDVKVYLYQILRGLAFIHSKNLWHRDMKPLNVAVDYETRIAKIIDFGSAKHLQREETNSLYAVSRYYRAPELMFGNWEYDYAIDVWSVGCIFAEMITGQPLFPGESSTHQLYEIFKILGTPSMPDITAMNPQYTEFKLPTIKAQPWTKILPEKTWPKAIDLISRMLVYNPAARITALEAMQHAFFNELRDKNTKFSEEIPLPDLFNFTDEEIERIEPQALKKLIPAWYEQTKTENNE